MATNTHTYNGNLVALTTNLNSLAGKKVGLYLSVEENNASADGAAWTSATVTGF